MSNASGKALYIVLHYLLLKVFYTEILKMFLYERCSEKIWLFISILRHNYLLDTKSHWNSRNEKVDKATKLALSLEIRVFTITHTFEAQWYLSTRDLSFTSVMKIQVFRHVFTVGSCFTPALSKATLSFIIYSRSFL